MLSGLRYWMRRRQPPCVALDELAFLFVQILSFRRRYSFSALIFEIGR